MERCLRREEIRLMDRGEELRNRSIFLRTVSEKLTCATKKLDKDVDDFLKEKMELERIYSEILSLSEKYKQREASRKYKIL
jgi:hypothetical protein